MSSLPNRQRHLQKSALAMKREFHVMQPSFTAPIRPGKWCVFRLVRL